MPSQIPGLQKSRNILPILQHNILLQYRSNTNTLSTSCTSHNTTEYGGINFLPRRALPSPNTALLKIHHITLCTCSKDIENKYDTYIELPNDGQTQRQSTSDYLVVHKRGKKLQSLCKEYYQIHPNMATAYICLNIIIICTSYTLCIYSDTLHIKNCTT